MSSSINAFFTMTNRSGDDTVAEIHPLETPKLRQCSPRIAIIAAPRRFDANRGRVSNPVKAQICIAVMRRLQSLN
jgi:hypothetical protein